MILLRNHQGCSKNEDTIEQSSSTKTIGTDTSAPKTKAFLLTNQVAGTSQSRKVICIPGRHRTKCQERQELTIGISRNPIGSTTISVVGTQGHYLPHRHKFGNIIRMHKIMNTEEIMAMETLVLINMTDINQMTNTESTWIGRSMKMMIGILKERDSLDMIKASLSTRIRYQVALKYHNTSNKTIEDMNTQTRQSQDSPSRNEVNKST